MEVTTSSGNLLTLRLGDVSNGLNLTNVTGLDPVKATLVSSNFSGQDGAQFQSATRTTRNITANVEFHPDPMITTVNTLRRQFYAFFRPKSKVTLKFYVDDTDDASEDGYQIVGYVEDCSAPMFSQTPGADISIICYDPDFVDPVPITVGGMTSADVSATTIAYPGTSPAGFVFTMNVNSAISEFTIYYTDPSENTYTMDFAASLLVGDHVIISTIPGQKYVNVIRAGVTSSYLYAISPQSTWPQLVEGNNTLRVVASGTPSTASIIYNAKYGEL